jgi:hypothetical protein
LFHHITKWERPVLQQETVSELQQETVSERWKQVPRQETVSERWKQVPRQETVSDRMGCLFAAMLALGAAPEERRC